MAVLFSLKRGFLANKKKNKANTAQTIIATNLGQRQVTPELHWAYGRLCPFQGETLPLRPVSLWLTYCRGNCPHLAFQLFPSRFQHLDIFCQQRESSHFSSILKMLLRTTGTLRPGYPHESFSWASGREVVQTIQFLLHHKLRILKGQVMKSVRVQQISKDHHEYKVTSSVTCLFGSCQQ